MRNKCRSKTRLNAIIYSETKNRCYLSKYCFHNERLFIYNSNTPRSKQNFLCVKINMSLLLWLYLYQFRNEITRTLKRIIYDFYVYCKTTRSTITFFVNVYKVLRRQILSISHRFNSLFIQRGYKQDFPTLFASASDGACARKSIIHEQHWSFFKF